MNSLPVTIADTNRTNSHGTLRALQFLVGGYLAVSALTLVAVVLLRDDAAVVSIAVWIRTVIVTASAVLMFAFTMRAARGSRGGFLRVRIMSAAMLVAIVVIIVLPGTFPFWLKVEQGVCGLILIGVVVVANGRRLRSSFASK